MVKERILSEQIFKAESFIGSNLILLALFGSGSRVEVDWGRLFGWGFIVVWKVEWLLGTPLFIVEVVFFLSTVDTVKYLKSTTDRQKES